MARFRSLNGLLYYLCFTDNEQLELRVSLIKVVSYDANNLLISPELVCVLATPLTKLGWVGKHKFVVKIVYLKSSNYIERGMPANIMCKSQ